MNKGKKTKQKTIAGGSEKMMTEKAVKCNQKRDGQPAAK
jgi:hypothetical protein